MSQAGLIDIEASHPQIPTSFVTDSGTAAPLSNVLEILATTVEADVIIGALKSKGGGNTVTLEIQVGKALAVGNIAKAGVVTFDSAAFSVSAAGHVTRAGGTGPAIDSFTTTVSGPVIPDALGAVAVTGVSIFSDGSITNSIALNVHATANTFLLGAGATTNVTELGPLTNGQLIIGSTGLSPVLGTLTGGPGVTIDNSVPGAITINSVLYSDQGSTVSVLSDSGSFSTAAITLTLPASPANGELCEFVASTADVLIVTAAGTQIVHLGNVATSAGGTCTSSAIGDSLTLRYQSSSDDWWATANIGLWSLA